MKKTTIVLLTFATLVSMLCGCRTKVVTTPAPAITPIITDTPAVSKTPVEEDIVTDTKLKTASPNTKERDTTTENRKTPEKVY